MKGAYVRPKGRIGFCNPSRPNPLSCLAPWSMPSGPTILWFYRIVVDVAGWTVAH